MSALVPIPWSLVPACFPLYLSIEPDGSLLHSSRPPGLLPHTQARNPHPLEFFGMPGNPLMSCQLRLPVPSTAIASFHSYPLSPVPAPTPCTRTMCGASQTGPLPSWSSQPKVGNRQAIIISLWIVRKAKCNTGPPALQGNEAIRWELLSTASPALSTHLRCPQPLVSLPVFSLEEAPFLLHHQPLLCSLALPSPARPIRD